MRPSLPKWPIVRPLVQIASACGGLVAIHSAITKIVASRSYLKLTSFHNRLINRREAAVKLTADLIRIYLWRMQQLMSVPTIMTILPGRYEQDGNGILVEVDPPRPCPELLTAEEAIRFLRLDDLQAPMDVLYQYRRQGLLRGTQVGRNIRYLRTELLRCLEKLTEEKPR